MVTFIDSSLGYESIARGNKTAAFCCRGPFWQTDQLRFGWPAKLDHTGPFWTNKVCENEFLRIMNFVATVDDARWQYERGQMVPDVIDYDPGNKRLKTELNFLVDELNSEL